MQTINEVLDLRIKIINNKYNLKVEVITITQQESVQKSYFLLERLSYKDISQVTIEISNLYLC